MPGNIAAAAPSGVLPQTLCTAFSESRMFSIQTNEYHDGSSQRGLITDGVNPAASIRTWKLSKRLTATDFATLKMFFEGQQGGLIPFYFYVPFENATSTHIGSNYDPSGSSVTGRHTCVFRGNWTETVGIARTDTSIEIAEIA